ncbi:hypothetical protein [Fischerella sp. PCC 9605]|uniref:hypothetical protein n=1 Tax=Fischerella sp. PCC 9605 TaxID=1173024 RepID=UPI00047BBE0C|nr:hypothetical protein [Fischerella sp. PCC 9605]
MIDIETAQQLGLKLKSLHKLLQKQYPRPLSVEDIAKIKNWSVADTAVIIELAVAADIITEKTLTEIGEDELVYTI